MDVGGDAFDVIELPDGRCCVYLADVSGHGVAPAMISSMLKAAATELIQAYHQRSPAFICNELHVRLCSTINNPAYYATFLLAFYDPKTGRWVCMNCGHPDPIMICNGEVVHFPPGGGGIPVGFSLGPDRPFNETDQTILQTRPGMHILFYTDGLSEAVHQTTGEECGAKSLETFFSEVSANTDVISSPDALFARMTSAEFVIGHDDCTAITIRMTDPEKVLLQRWVDVDLTNVSICAEEMERHLLDFTDENLAGRVRLVAMEHAVNVVEHSGLGAQDTMWTQLFLDETCCRLVFKDCGREWDLSNAGSVVPQFDDYAEGGRGLFITNMIADHVERYRRGSVNIVNYIFKR